MSWWYRRLVRPTLFAQNAESIHNRTIRGLAWAGRHELICDALVSCFGAPQLPTELFGLKFPNPVGLAAGMDKSASALPAWAALGFGFTELGGVTWHAQPGNPQPRMFRAVSEQIIINRMGFNNPGAEVMAKTLAGFRSSGRWPSHPVSINLGKSKITPLERAPEDYANSFKALQSYADFFVVNVSSPNTPGLRELQDKAALSDILVAIQECQRNDRRRGAEENNETGSEPASFKPILVKVAPDLSFEALDDILELVGPRQIAGIVATNTTITRPATNDPALRRVFDEAGGLSGPPLRARSTEVIRHLYRQTKGRLPIIGVGGVFDAEDAWEKLRAGAALVQLYTGLVYEGPGIARSIVRGLKERLLKHGFGSLRQVIGTGHKSA